jgi:hypothetical protein
VGAGAKFDRSGFHYGHTLHPYVQVVGHGGRRARRIRSAAAKAPWPRHCVRAAVRSSAAG